MEQITLRVPADTLAELEDEADERGISRSEHIRNALETRNEHAEDVADLRAEIDDLETELDRVREEKRLILREREEKAELARYVEDERTAEQRWREAGLGTRLKWRVFGMPGDDGDG
jgi:hypothetical protein